MTRKFLYGVCKTFLLYVLVLLSSCGSTKNIIYFQNAESRYDSSIDSSEYRIRIMNNDNLLITVITQNPQASEVFNVSKQLGGITGSISSNLQWTGYLVDQSGNINFPLIGTVHLAGLTKQEAIDLLQKRISEYVDDPVVNIRFMNYEVFVLGEVKNPGSVMVSDEKITLLEALSLAGDMTIYGNRHNVMVYRETEGSKQHYRVDMTSPNVFNSPVYYLQQGDVVYVEPNKARAMVSTDFRQNISLGISLISIALTIALFFKK